MIEMDIILVGVGHEMHGDDESGLEIVRRWVEISAERYPEVQTALLDDPGLNLLGLIAGRDAAILVAAVRAGAPLGTVQVFSAQDLVELTGASGKGGARGAAETLSLGRRLAGEDLPGVIILVGIEGAVFGLGEGLSPAVRGGIPTALAMIDQEIQKIKEEDRSLRVPLSWVTMWLRKIFTRSRLK